MNYYIQIGTNQANDHFFEIVKRNKDVNKKIILVEPLQELHPVIQSCYKNVNTLHLNLIKAAVIPDESQAEVVFYKALTNNHLSSVDKAHIEKHNTQEGIEEVKVKAITFNKLMALVKFKPERDDILCLYVDAEGMDLEIIKSINFERFMPEKIYFERVHVNEQEAREFLTEKGYNVYQYDDLTSVALLK